MKKKINIEKRVDFPTMIGEVCAISLEHDLKFIDDLNVNGDLILSGKYKMTEASRLEEDFLYRFPVEIALTEKLDLNTTKIEIADFYYEIENDDIMICHIELEIEGLEVIEFCDNLFADRDCDGDLKNEEEKEIPVKVKKDVEEDVIEKEEKVEINDDRENDLEDRENVVEDRDDLNNSDSVEEKKEDKDDDKNMFMNFDEENETYGTFLVYIVRQNETVNSILEKYNTSLEELEKYNDLKSITIGTKLIIPLLKENDK